MADFRLPWSHVKKTATGGEVTAKGPGGWLLSRQLISKLRLIGLYTLFGDKLDPRDWMQSEPIDFSKEEDGTEFWFDYICDTGDGQLATYNVAYLAMSELSIPSPDVGPGPDRVAWGKAGVGGYTLPRGRFLFVGGDSGYHIADHATLAQRFQTPFNWAYDDIFDAPACPPPETRRPIIAIPANHDYYDALDGFNRQFRKTLLPEPYDANPANGPQLCLKGFYRVQDASYVAIKLPHSWWLWGVDCQEGKADQRQIEFFNQHGRDAAGPAVPDKLIVATPEPSTVYGKWWKQKKDKKPGDRDLVDTFSDLGLPRSFLEEQDGELKDAQCRLDISGDIHHYARHWGKALDGADAERTRSNYASVVAGGGGAFLHPTYTNIGEVRANRLYPDPLDSFKLAARRLLQPWIIFQGGLVWLAGALAVMYAYFAVTVPESTWALFSWLVPEAARPPMDDSLLGRIRTALDVESSAGIWGLIGYLFTSRYLVEVGYVAFLFWFLAKRVLPREAELREKLRAPEDEWHRLLYTFVGRSVLAGLPLIVLLWWPPDAKAAPSMLNSLMIVAYVAIAWVSFKISLWYSDLLVDRAVQTDDQQRVFNVSIVDVLPQWSFVAFSIISVWYGLWRFGHNQLSITVTEVFLVLLFAGLILGLYALATGLGSELLSADADRKRFKTIGLWHWVMQLLVPLFLTLYGGWMAFLLSLAVVAAAGYALNRYVQDLQADALQEDKKAIAGTILKAWFAVGGIALLIGVASGVFGGGTEQVTWCRLFIAAPFLGAVFSCVWLGWYLVATALYDGHNNEAGGGTLSADYRHLVRIRLTENDLTAYVIGIDKPKDLASSASSERTFRLVDVFTIGR